jgi:hypothetical protein
MNNNIMIETVILQLYNDLPVKVSREFFIRYVVQQTRTSRTEEQIGEILYNLQLKFSDKYNFQRSSSISWPKDIKEDVKCLKKYLLQVGVSNYSQLMVYLFKEEMGMTAKKVNSYLSETKHTRRKDLPKRKTTEEVRHDSREKFVKKIVTPRIHELNTALCIHKNNPPQYFRLISSVRSEDLKEKTEIDCLKFFATIYNQKYDLIDIDVDDPGNIGIPVEQLLSLSNKYIILTFRDITVSSTARCLQNWGWWKTGSYSFNKSDSYLPQIITQISFLGNSINKSLTVINSAYLGNKGFGLFIQVK